MLNYQSDFCNKGDSNINLCIQLQTKMGYKLSNQALQRKQRPSRIPDGRKCRKQYIFLDELEKYCTEDLEKYPE